MALYVTLQSLQRNPSPRPGLKIAFVQAPDGMRLEILERSAV